MESGRTLHYRGNTVKKQNKKPKKGDRTTKIDSKVFATKKCVWCNAKFDDYQIVCHICLNCQYCGLMSGCLDICRLCGNLKPIELKKKRPRFVI